MAAEGVQPTTKRTAKASERRGLLVGDRGAIWKDGVPPCSDVELKGGGDFILRRKTTGRRKGGREMVSSMVCWRARFDELIPLLPSFESSTLPTSSDSLGF